MDEQPKVQITISQSHVRIILSALLVVILLFFGFEVYRIHVLGQEIGSLHNELTQKDDQIGVLKAFESQDRAALQQIVDFLNKATQPK